MAKYKNLTHKELSTRLEQSEKASDALKKDNKKLRELLLSIETDLKSLATANEQVEELRTAVDNLTTEKVELEKDLEDRLKSLDCFKNEFAIVVKNRDELKQDQGYERERRISAENKLYDLEKRLHTWL